MLNVDPKVVGAIFRKDLRTYLANPTGYVFLTLFIAVTGAAAFLQDDFFSRNLADLAPLNRFMPSILMLFVPAITMSAWADERRAGTDELLLTMPVRDGEVILGKYFGAVGMYTVSLGFSLAHVGVLAYLGDPDPGLMVSTYVGYWLMGLLFLAVGLLASMMTQNATVAFILGAVGCAGLVFAGAEPWASGLLGVVILGAVVALGSLAFTGSPTGVGLSGGLGAVLGIVAWLWDPESFTQWFSALSATEHFASFGEGLLQLGDALYFVGFATLLLYLAGLLLGRRHW